MKTPSAFRSLSLALSLLFIQHAVPQSVGPDPTEAPWDLLLNVPISPGPCSAIETDGNVIIVGFQNPAAAGNYMFARYDLSGNYLNHFNISGWVPAVGNGPRDLDYDGTYFYATDGTGIIRIFDGVSYTLTSMVSTSQPGLIHISINDDNGNIYTGSQNTLYEVAPNGNIIHDWTSTLGGLDFITGCAYDNYSDNGPFLWLYSRYPSGTEDARIYCYDLVNHTLNTSSWKDTHTLPNSPANGQAAGLAATSLLVPGKFCLLGIQFGMPNIMFAYELASTITWDYDVGVSSIIKPSSGGNILLNYSPVKIAIKNYGNLPVSNINVQFRLGAASPVNETWMGILQPGDTVHYTFTATMNVNQYCVNYVLKCRTLLMGDMNPSDDEKIKFFSNILPSITDTVYPSLAPLWTGTTDDTAILYASNIQIQAQQTNPTVGWAKFGMSGIPDGVKFNSATLHLFATQPWSHPEIELRHLVVDPLTASPSQLATAIKTGMLYNTFSDNIDTLVPVWIAIQLPDTAMHHLTDATISDYYALGFHEPNTTNALGTFDGWAQPHPPYIVVNYNEQFQHDVGIVSFVLPSYIPQGVYTPVCTVGNFGLNTEVFTVTINGPGGYTATLTSVTLSPGTVMTYSFPPLMSAPNPNACFTVCTNLTSDPNFCNDCETRCTVIYDKLTRAYGFNTDSAGPASVHGSVRFFLEAPQASMSQVGGGSLPAPGFFSAGAWAEDTWYAAEYYDTAAGYAHGHLYTIDTATGILTDIGPLHGKITGMSYDHYSGTMWATGPAAGTGGTYHTLLYMIDLTSGNATPEFDFGPGPGLTAGLAFGDNGMLFTTDIISERLIAIDPIQHWFEVACPLNHGLEGDQDLEFNKATNELYLAARDLTGGALWKTEPSNGNLSLAGNFPGNFSMSALAIPYHYVPQSCDIGVQWIEQPRNANLTAFESVIVKLWNFGLYPADSFQVCFRYNNVTHCDQWSSVYPVPLPPYDTIQWYFDTIVDMSNPGYHCLAVWTQGLACDTFAMNDTVFKCPFNYNCGLISCLTGYANEPEFCGDNLNNGCSAGPGAFTDIQIGDTYCGTLWKVDSLRDTDVYRFHLAAHKSIIIGGIAEYNIQVQLRRLPCSIDSLLGEKIFTKCVYDSLVFNAVSPGDYALSFAHDFADYNTLCSGNSMYSFRLNMSDPHCCKPSHLLSCSGEHITNVIFNTINNTSACGLENGYSDYGQFSTTLYPGNTYNLTIISGPVNSGDVAAAWIDWNRDWDFNDPGEKYPLNLQNLGSQMLFTAVVSVPPGTLPGMASFRIRLAKNVSLQDIDPCAIYQYGECEDYSLDFMPAPPFIIARLPDLTGTCFGNVDVPVLVENFLYVNGFNLVFSSPGVTLLGYDQVNPALSGAVINVMNQPNAIKIWGYAQNAVSIGDDILMMLHLNIPQGMTSFIWDTLSPDSCYYYNYSVGWLPSFWINATMNFGNCTAVEGLVQYARKVGGTTSPITIHQGVTVELWDGNILAYTTNIDSSGHYLFPSINTGTYTLKASSTMPFGGVASSDALMILRHFVQMPPLLEGLYLQVADVDGSGYPNGADALHCLRRFVGVIPNFLPPHLPFPGSPDWQSETFNITINGSANITQDLLMLCTGDVNGSFTPP